MTVLAAKKGGKGALWKLGDAKRKKRVRQRIGIPPYSYCTVLPIQYHTLANKRIEEVGSWKVGKFDLQTVRKKRERVLLFPSSPFQFRLCCTSTHHLYLTQYCIINTFAIIFYYCVSFPNVGGRLPSSGVLLLVLQQQRSPHRTAGRGQIRRQRALVKSGLQADLNTGTYYNIRDILQTSVYMATTSFPLNRITECCTAGERTWLAGKRSPAHSR